MPKMTADEAITAIRECAYYTGAGVESAALTQDAEEAVAAIREAFADYAPPVDGDIFASISDVFTCPVCGGSGHREPPNGIDDVRCYQCGGSGSVRVISTHYLEWLIEQVAWCDEVCEKDHAYSQPHRG